MILQGRVWKYGESIDTDGIYPGRYLVTFDPAEVALHVMEGVDPDFVRKVRRGDLIVAGRNFGCGSAREQAAVALQQVGVAAVLAESFARTFFRNAINVGLPVLEVPGISTLASDGDELRVDLASGTVLDLTTDSTLQGTPLPEFIRSILEKGGAIPFYLSRQQR